MYDFKFIFSTLETGLENGNNNVMIFVYIYRSIQLYFNKVNFFLLSSTRIQRLVGSLNAYRNSTEERTEEEN